MARLIFKFKNKVLDIIPLPTTQGVTIGRHHTNTIVIDNLVVSGFHARIDMNEDGVMLTDLRSKNGTFVNGKRMDEGPLNDRDEIAVGKHTLVLDLHDNIAVEKDAQLGAMPRIVPSAMSNASTMTLDTSNGGLMRAPPQTLPKPVYAESDKLVILAGGQGEIALSQSHVTIGSNKEADIPVAGFWGLLVGRSAVTISKQATVYVMRYNGGLIKPKRNGTSVISTIKLNHEDVVEVGPVQVQVLLSKP